jgi:hypothetical protein
MQPLVAAIYRREILSSGGDGDLSTAKKKSLLEKPTLLSDMDSGD